MTRNKKRWKKIRKEFKTDIQTFCNENPIFAITIFKTYTSSQNRRHITQIWELLGTKHRDAYKTYCDELIGKYLSGSDGLLDVLYFCNKPLYEKWKSEIPACYAMGEALGVAYRMLTR